MGNTQNIAVLMRNKRIARTFYEGAVRGDITGFGAFLHRDFTIQAPNYLPWGGLHRGADAYLHMVLPQVAQALDFSRFSFESLTAEDDRVIAVINVGVMQSDARIMVSEHWVIQGEKALALWVAYYEPGALLQQLERNSTSFRMPTSIQL